MQELLNLVVLLVWVGLCAALIYGIERALEAAGVRHNRIEVEGHVPPLAPDP